MNAPIFAPADSIIFDGAIPGGAHRIPRTARMYRERSPAAQDTAPAHSDDNLQAMLRLVPGLTRKLNNR
jgi:hypothetical protein